MDKLYHYTPFFVFCSFLLLYSGAVSGQTAVQDTLYKRNPNYSHELALYDIYEIDQADIVMLGNSITHGANWNELLGRDDIVERGIPSDITSGYLNRMEYIYGLNPKIVFIMGGINDIYNWTPVETITVNYLQIIKNLQARGIEPVIQSTLYAGRDWPKSEDRNKEVTRLNRHLRNYARENGLTFIDLNKRMSEDNFLRDELTHDSLHLNANGFKIWKEEVKKVLNEKGYTQ